MKSIHRAVHSLGNPNLGLLFIRIALGVVFINQGWMKITHIESVVGFFAMIGIPAMLAYLVAYVEFVGGIMLLLGIFSRYIGIMFSVIMITAIIKVHFAHGFDLQNGGYEYVFVLLCMSLAMFMSGSGKYSIGNMMSK